MSWPYLKKEIVNVGTLEEPDFQPVPKFIWIPGKGKGPYNTCVDCRAIKQKRYDEWFRQQVARLEAGQEAEEKAPYFKMNFSIMGAARCVKHILRFHKRNGTLTPELEADVRHRDEIHKKLRDGDYYGER